MLEEQKDLKKSHLITFIKSEDKVKSLELLNEKIRNFKSLCEEAELDCCRVVSHFNDVLSIMKGKKKNMTIAQKE